MINEGQAPINRCLIGQNVWSTDGNMASRHLLLCQYIPYITVHHITSIPHKSWSVHWEHRTLGITIRNRFSLPMGATNVHPIVSWAHVYKRQPYQLYK